MNALLVARGILATLPAIALVGCGTAPCGACGIAGYQVVVQPANLSAQQQRTITVQCPAGKKALGGGFGGTESNLQVFESRPMADGSGWQISAKSAWILPSSIQADAYVVCANS